ncbi:MAG: hypothetical protein U0S50_00665 [Sphingopyxis sp.]|nr:hypothetical protein [Sphingopyxis sp.]
MHEASDIRRQPTLKGLLRGLRPAVPAIIGAAALTFLVVAVMPMAWVAAISWNLYLDRLSDFFVPPVGNAARLGLAIGMAGAAAIVAGFVALLVTRPEETGVAALARRIRGRKAAASADDEAVLPRRRADLHPDDALRPPIRAGRDLPPEGLGPLVRPFANEEAPVDIQVDVPADPVMGDGGDELILADLAPDAAVEPGEEPWLQPVAATGPALPDPSDNSLGAMVARLEAGLSRRRVAPGGPSAPAIPVPGSAAAETAPETDAGSEADPEIDFALEAALGTLQRLNRQATG